MAFEVISTNPGGIYDVNSSDTVVLPRDVIVTSVGDGLNAVPDSGPVFNEVSIRLFGQIYAGARGIDFWGLLAGTTSYNFNEIWIATTGVVSGVTFGILTESGEGNSITNFGQIVADVGVESYGGINHSITNGGSITGLDGAAVRVVAEIDATGFQNCVILNEARGTIHSDTAAGISLESLAGGSRIDNLGLISASTGFAIDLAGVNVGQGVITVFNGGTILGGQGSFNGSQNADVLTNRGQMNGDVLLGSGDDLLNTLTGTVIGLIDMGDGNDRVQGNADEAEVIEGGLGTSDTLDFRYGAAVGVALDSSFDNSGAALGDGYTGFERVLGSALADVIRGSVAANQLMGNSGADVIDGAEGADLLRGGTGADTLTGGLGNDTFRFSALAECGDTITDFRNVAGDNDKFQIDAAAFGGGLTAGGLAGTQFQNRADNLAQDADDRFIFRTSDSTLWFDADGTGALAARMVADLQAGATMSAADIQLI